METYEQREEQKAGQSVKADYSAPKDSDWITRNGNRIVAIDIDGTITKGGRWFGEGEFKPLMPAAKSRIQRLKKDGWVVVIYSVRKDKQRIADWLNLVKIPFDYIETKPCYYTVLIDDRAIPFESWEKITLPAQTLPETDEE